MTSETASIRRYFWIILIIATIAGVGVAHCYYYFDVKAELARELALHPDKTAANYRINYWNLPHEQTLMYGAVGGLIVGALAGWIVDGVRCRRAIRATEEHLAKGRQGETDSPGGS